MQTKTLLTTTSLAALTVAASLGLMSVASAHGIGTQNPEVKQERQVVMKQAKTLREAGKLDEARQLLRDSGIKFRPFQRRPRPEKRQAIKTALDNNDYQAFVTATADAPFASKITPEIFAKMIEARTLRQAGDQAGAKAIMDQIGIRPPMHKAHRPFLKKRFGDKQRPAQPAPHAQS